MRDDAVLYAVTFSAGSRCLSPEMGRRGYSTK